MADHSVKDQQWWENYFAVGGQWEENGGRFQTRVFAENFTAHADILAQDVFSLLDVGCALGDALKHFSKEYPKASLYGVDFSNVAIERCKKEFDRLARFSTASIDDIEGQYDVIYCSNMLEHFADFDDKARKLATHCSRLCILVPFNELKNGLPLRPSATEHHQKTFYEDSFDFLVRDGLATRIRTAVFSCPGAWGWTLKSKIKQEAMNLVRAALGRPKAQEPMQILFDITIR